jgi:pyridoxal phosphate enzyme (YggS family)
MQPVEELTIGQRLERVNQTINRAAERAGRNPDDITLVAVSKTFGPDQVVEVARSGVSHFGENRIQEAEAKIPVVGRLAEASELPRLTWHLVGHLQTNKIRLAASLFTMIESVDSVRLAVALDRQAREGEHRIDVLLEVNVGGEASKFGFAPDEVADAYGEISALRKLRICGLMTVAPPVEIPEKARPYFRTLRELRDVVARSYHTAELVHLSMGMSGDYPVAIEEGATIVRVGRAIFGERSMAT